ncbi:MAG TPA: MFS transporter, partial [Microlunatus sp.]|nr:MFS transporter [Microlunatus sp.]
MYVTLRGTPAHPPPRPDTVEGPLALCPELVEGAPSTCPEPFDELRTSSVEGDPPSLTSTDGHPTASNAKARAIAPTVIALGVVSLLTDISSESVSAVLPLYLTAVLGMSPLAYGFIDGLYQGVSALVRMLGGWWADSSGRPKWVAFVGYAGSAASRIALLVTTSFVGITGAVTADRLGKGLRTGPRDALIAASAPPAQLGRNFGVHRALDTTGALAGPLLAFAVLALIPVGLGGYHSV